MSSHLSICVFCGSRDGAEPAYAEDAASLGRAVAEAGWRMVYGAGDVGLMGAAARAAKQAGGDTFGVIPIHLMAREVARRDLGRFIVTENMHERKKVMYMNSDAIAVLAGGAGTLDEFFEVLTWRQLMLHAKPIYLVNTCDYWTPLTGLIDHVIDQGFADASLRGFYRTVADVPELMHALETDFS